MWFVYWSSGWLPAAQWHIYNSLHILQKVVERFKDDLLNKLWSLWDRLDYTEEKIDESFHTTRVTTVFKFLVFSGELRVLYFSALKINSSGLYYVYSMQFCDRKIRKIWWSIWRRTNFSDSFNSNSYKNKPSYPVNSRGWRYPCIPNVKHSRLQYGYYCNNSLLYSLIIWNFGNYTYSLSCQALGEKIDTILRH